MFEIILADIAQDSYDYVMAIINYVCFGSVCACAVILCIMLIIGQWDYWYKRLATGALIALITLFVIHFWLEAEVGIPLIVPPVDTVYFTEFMHVIQYIASISVLILGGYVFACGALKLVDNHQFGRAFMGGIFALGIIIILHGYLLDNFGILLIFPPNLW